MNKSLNHSVYQITMINYVSEDKDPRVTVKPKYFNNYEER